MEEPKKALFRARLICAAISVILLFFVFRRISPGELLAAFRVVDVGWYMAAAVLYGMLFLPAACRLHLAFRLTNAAVNFQTTARYSLIGHFFYTILFGAAGGDVARSMVYARWNRLPLPHILAASSLDRLLGFVGLLVFMGIAIAIAFTDGAPRQLRSVSLEWPGWWLLAVTILIAIAVVVLRRCRPESFGGRFVTAFSQSGRKLARSPGVFSIGALCGFAVQIALSGVLALNLEAVSGKPLPWLQLAWTFPVITVVSALPITIAGLGVREGAALALFGLCGVPAADAVAAALLTASVSLLWTIAGGVVLWVEASRHQRDTWAKDLFAMPKKHSDETV